MINSNNEIRILLIDDNKGNQYIFKRLLSNTPYMFFEALTGQEGLKILEENRVDLIILDINLPDISGYEMCRFLKKNPKTSRIPIVMTSALFNQPEAQIRGLEAGAEAYLLQPEDPQVLIAIIQSIVKNCETESSTRNILTSESNTQSQIQKLLGKMYSFWSISKFGIWEWNSKEKKMYCSEITKELLHLPKEKYFFSLREIGCKIIQKDFTLIKVMIQNSLNNKRDFDTEARLSPTGKGFTRWVRLIGHGIYEHDANLIRAMGCIIDITTLKNTENELTKIFLP